MTTPAQHRYTRAISAAAEWKPKLRWLISRILRVEALEAAVGEAEADRGEDAVAVGAEGAREGDGWSEPRSGGPGEPRVEMRRRQPSVVEVVEQPEILAQQEDAVEPAVGVLDLAQRGQLADRLALGRLEQRPAGALDPAAGRGVRALVGVPFVAADLVGGACREADDVERIEADLGVGDRLADGALVLAAHVDRDRPDRVLARPELVEERLQCGAVAARSAPHDRSGAVVGDRRQVAVMTTVGDLVDADADEALQAALVEMLGDHTGDDPPDRVPADPEQPGDRRAGHLLRQPRDDVLEVARVRAARSRPRHRLHPHPAGAAAQQPQLALDHAAAGAEIEVPPALDAPGVELAPAGLTAPAGTRVADAAVARSRAPPRP